MNVSTSVTVTITDEVSSTATETVALVIDVAADPWWQQLFDFVANLF